MGSTSQKTRGVGKQNVCILSLMAVFLANLTVVVRADCNPGASELADCYLLPQFVDKMVLLKNDTSVNRDSLPNSGFSRHQMYLRLSLQARMRDSCPDNQDISVMEFVKGEVQGLMNFGEIMSNHAVLNTSEIRKIWDKIPPVVEALQCALDVIEKNCPVLQGMIILASQPTVPFDNVVSHADSRDAKFFKFWYYWEKKMECLTKKVATLKGGLQSTHNRTDCTMSVCV